MIRALYSLALWLAQPVLRHKLARRGRSEPGYLHAVEQRFGRYGDAPQPAVAGLVWVHAVSLGETRAAALLVAALRTRLPGMRLLLTHGTATGRSEGAALLRDGDIQVWQPWDTPWAVRRFLAHFRPRIGILMETEVWPNMAQACKSGGVPLVLANARLSEKSLRQALRLPGLSGPAYAALAAVWAQSQADAARLKELGAPVQAVFGNLKFDAAPDADQLRQGAAWKLAASGRPVVLLASSRAGEEAGLLQILQAQAARAGPDAPASTPGSLAQRVQWLIVPRHPQRFDEVAGLIVAHGFTLSRRSQWLDAPSFGLLRGDTVPSGMPDGGGLGVEIWLGDSMGEMALYYAMSDVALLGGSFEPLGGQNLIEAAACACPVVMGPNTFNFLEAAELAQAAGAALRAPALQPAVQLAVDLACDSARCQQLARAASDFAAAHRGATERTARAITELLLPRP